MNPVDAVAEGGWDAILRNTYTNVSSSISNGWEWTINSITTFFDDVISPVVTRIAAVFQRISAWLDVYAKANPEITAGVVVGFVVGTVITLFYQWCCVMPTYEEDDDAPMAPPVPISTSSLLPSSPLTITIEPSSSQPSSTPSTPSSVASQGGNDTFYDAKDPAEFGLAEDPDELGLGELRSITGSMTRKVAVTPVESPARSPAPPDTTTNAVPEEQSAMIPIPESGTISTMIPTRGVALSGVVVAGTELAVVQESADPPSQPLHTIPQSGTIATVASSSSAKPLQQSQQAQPPRKQLGRHIEKFVSKIEPNGKALPGQAQQLTAAASTLNAYVGSGTFSVKRGHGRSVSTSAVQS